MSNLIFEDFKNVIDQRFKTVIDDMQFFNLTEKESIRVMISFVKMLALSEKEEIKSLDYVDSLFSSLKKDSLNL